MPVHVRRLIVSILLLVGTGLAHAAVPSAPAVEGSAWLLMDARSGQVLTEHNAEQPLPPASLTKLMSSYIAAEELAAGHISLDDEVLVSVKAWKMGGSRMFIQEGTRVPVGELLKGIIIQSGNDATVALAEHIAGSEEAFVDLMNQYATRLGMTGSHFMNATGWPHPEHYSTARDIALLGRALIREHPEHYRLYSQKSYTWNDITQQNRNLLLWRDERVDGMKTGHTEEAGYCLVASAVDGNMRLISVVMGTASEQARARETQKLLTWGFRFFETYEAYRAHETLAQVPVWMGTTRQLDAGLAEDLVLTIPRGSHDSLEAEMVIAPDLRAPLAKGDPVGRVVVRQQGEILVEAPLVALAEVERAGFLTRLWHHILIFFGNLF